MSEPPCWVCGNVMEGQYCPRCDVEPRDGPSSAGACSRCAELERELQQARAEWHEEKKRTREWEEDMRPLLEERDRLAARVQELERENAAARTEHQMRFAEWQAKQKRLQARVQELEASQCPETCYPPTTGRCELIHERDRLAAEVERLKAERADFQRGHHAAWTENDRLRAQVAMAREALEWYARGEHYALEEWESASGEPERWLNPPTDDPWQVEDGTRAREALAAMDAGKDGG